MTVPNFLIIGAHKAGTSSLHRYLQQHPEIFLPTLKEPRFFSYDPDGADVEPSPYAWGPRVHPVKTWNEYLDLFTAVTTEMLPVGLLPQIGDEFGRSESTTGLLISLYAAMVMVLGQR